jgi:hypothetical protein
MRAIRYSIALLLLTSLAASSLAGTYVAGGTFVVKAEVGTLLDNGGVVCEGTDGDGVGGGCLLFPSEGREGGFVGVLDDEAGTDVAFQVCIDNDGDGICGGPQPADGRCFDQIFFSHDDEGRFFNPLGPLPTSFLEGCAGGFPGYVVLLCQGAHEAGGAAHTHTLTGGSIKLMGSGSGYGDFCGGANGGAAGPFGNNPAVAKAYRVV